eukprot:tig00000269_g23749.t1
MRHRGQRQQIAIAHAELEGKANLEMQRRLHLRAEAELESFEKTFSLVLCPPAISPEPEDTAEDLGALAAARALEDARRAERGLREVMRPPGFVASARAVELEAEEARRPTGGKNH